MLGGGIVAGSVVLIGGDPGIGKSTLILQMLSALAGRGRKVLYVSGEESAHQIKLRAQRLSALDDNHFLATESSVEKILAILQVLDQSLVKARHSTSVRTMLETSVVRCCHLQNLDQLKSRFFTNISHEFRTPLTLLQGLLQRLEREPEAGDAATFAMMTRNARRLGQLIDQLLDLSRLEAGALPLDDVFEAVQMSVNPKVIECYLGEPHAADQ